MAASSATPASRATRRVDISLTLCKWAASARSSNPLHFTPLSYFTASPCINCRRKGAFFFSLVFLLLHACHAGLPNSSTTNLILQWAQPNLMSAVLLEAPPPWRRQPAASGHSAPCCSCRSWCDPSVKCVHCIILLFYIIRIFYITNVREICSCFVTRFWNFFFKYIYRNIRFLNHQIFVSVSALKIPYRSGSSFIHIQVHILLHKPRLAACLFLLCASFIFSESIFVW